MWQNNQEITEMKQGIEWIKQEIRGIGVMLVHMGSKVDLLIEGFGALDRKIERFRDEVNEKFRKVDYKFEVVFDELHAIRAELAGKADRKEFTLLDQRILKLEKTGSE